MSKLDGMFLVLVGVSQLAVAVNKMDTVEWAKTRFDEITRKLKQFLKQAGFKVNFIECILKLFVYMAIKSLY